MSNLEPLVFSVDTSQLDVATKKVEGLADSLMQLEAASKHQQSAEVVAARTAADNIKAKAELARANAGLTRATNSLAKAEQKAAEALTSSKSAAESSTPAIDKFEKLLGNLNNTYTDLARGFTRGEASILNVARNLGASANQLSEVEQKLKQIKTLTKDPFDSSIGSIRSITQELESLKARAQSAGEAMFFTKKQFDEFSKISIAVGAQLTSKGVNVESGFGKLQFVEDSIKAQLRYKEVATQVNSLREAERIENEKQEAQLKAQAAAQRAAADVMTQAVTKYNEVVVATDKLQDSTRRLNEITAMIASGMSKEEAQLRSTLATQGVASSAVDLHVAAMHNMNKALAEQQRLQKANNGVMDEAVAKFYAQKQATESAKSSLEDYVTKMQQKIQQDSLAQKYVEQGASRSTANRAARAEMEGVGQEDVQTLVKTANAYDAVIRKKQEVANANRLITETEQRLAAALDQTNYGLNQQATDTLVKYSNALKATGVSADVAAAKMAALKNQLEQVTANERAQQLQHLARAISVQMGDIAISLASGQNPLIVMIQQADQVRGAIDQAQAKGKELQTAMNAAAANIATGFKNTAIAIGSFAFGAIEKLGASIVSLAGKTLPTQTAINKFAENARDSGTLLTTGFTEQLDLMQRKLDITAKGAGIAATIIIAALATLTTAVYQTIAVQQELGKTLTMQGALYGITSAEAIGYADAVKVMGISSNEAASALNEMLKAGVPVSGNLSEITRIALELEKYGGVAIETVANKYADLGKDPLKVLTQVAVETGNVNLETLQLVDSLIDQGDKVAAVQLATEAMQSAHRTAIEDMKNQLTPLSALWINIKSLLGEVWQAVIDIGKTDQVIYAFRLAWASLASPVIVLNGVIKALAVELAFVATGFDRIAAGKFDNIGELLTIRQEQLKSIKDEMDARLMSLKLSDDAANSTNSLAAAVKKSEAEKVASWSASQKAMKSVNDQYDKLQTKTMSLTDFQKKFREDTLKAANAENKYGTTVTFTTEELKKQDAVAKKLWEDAQKKDKKGRTPTEKFVDPASDINELKKRYSTELRLAEQVGKDQRAILKMHYDAQMVDRGTFIAQDLQLVLQGEQKRRKVIEDEGSKVQKAYKERMDDLLAEEARLSKSSMKGAPEALARVQKEIKQLKSETKTFTETQDAALKSLESDVVRRYNESLTESNKAMIALNKQYDDFIKKQDDAAESRNQELVASSVLARLTGAEAVAYKAKTDAIKSMVPEINAFAKEAATAAKDYEDFMNAVEGPLDESAQKAFEQRRDLLLKQKQNAEIKVNQAVAKSGEYAEKAKTDAVLKYYQDEVNRISEGLAGVLTTAIFDGGEEGAKALRSFIEQELRKKFTIEIQANLITPIVDSVFNALGMNTGSGAGIGSGGSAISAAKSMWDIASNASNIAAGAGTFLGTKGAKLLTDLGFDVASDALTNFSAGMIDGTSSLGGFTGAFKQGGTQLAGAIAGSVLNGFSVYGLSKALSGGYSAGGAVNTIAGIAGMIPGVGPLAGAVGGLVNRAFGRKFAGSGIEATFGGQQGATGRAYEDLKGGWFRSDKTNYSELAKPVENLLASAFRSMQVQVGAFAQSIGLSTDKIASFTTTIKIKTDGLDEAGVTDAINKAIEQGSNELAQQIIGSWENVSKEVKTTTWDGELQTTIKTVDELTYKQSEYARQGETALETLTRLGGSLITANQFMKLFGDTLYESTIKGADAASTLADAFGGLEQFQQDMQKFYQSTTTPLEQTITAYADFRKQIEGLGVHIPTGTQGMKDLANSLDLTTESGRTTYATLIKVAPAMLEAGDALLQSLGTSTSDLANIILEGMQNSDPSNTGKYFAETIMFGINQAMYSNFANQIVSILTNSLLGPMMTGATLAELVANGAIDSMIADAKRASEALNTFLTNPEIQAAMQQVSGLVSQVISSVVSSVPVMPKAPENPWTTRKGVNSAENSAGNKAEEAAKKATEAWSNLIDSLSSRKLDAEIQNIYLTQGEAAGVAAERLREYNKLVDSLTVTQEVQATATSEATTIVIEATEAQKAEIRTRLEAIYTIEDQNKALEKLHDLQKIGLDLEIQVLKALGFEEEALSKEREAAIKGMNRQQIEQYDLNKSTEVLIGNIRRLQQGFDDAINTFATPEEKILYGYSKTLEKLAGVGLDLDVASITEATDKDILSFIVSVANLGDISAETRATLVEGATAIGGFNRQIRDLTDGLNSSYKKAFNSFATPDQRFEASYTDITSELDSLGIKGVTPERLKQAANEDLRTFSDAIMQLSGVSVETKTRLLDLVGTVADLGNQSKLFDAGIYAEYDNANLSLLRAQGTHLEADSLERSLFIRGLSELTTSQKGAKIAAYDYAKAVEAQIKNLQVLKEVANERATAEIVAYRALDDETSAANLERKLFVEGLVDLTESQRAAKISAYDFAKSIDSLANDLQKSQQKLEDAKSRVESAQDTINSMRETATDNYLSALGKVDAVQKSIADKARETANEFREIAKSLREYLTGFEEPVKRFADVLKQALGGSAEAMGNLSDAANAAIEDSKKSAGSSVDFRREQQKILLGVTEAVKVAEKLSKGAGEDPAEDLQTQLKEAKAELAKALSIATEIGASLTKQDTFLADYQKALTDLVTAQKDQKDAETEITRIKAELTALVTNTGNTATNTDDIKTNTSDLDLSIDAASIEANLAVNAVVKATTTEVIPPATLALINGTVDSLKRTITAVTQDIGMSEATKVLALGTTASLARTITTTVTSTSLTEELKTLVLGTNDDLVRLLNVVVTDTGLTANLKAVGVGTLATVTETVNTILTDTGLTANLKAVGLDSLNAVVKQVEVTLKNPNLPENLKLIGLDKLGEVTKQINAVVSSQLPTDTKQLLLSSVSDPYRTAVSLGVNLTSALTAEQRLVLSTAEGTINRIVNASVTQGYLTPDQRTLLEAQTGNIYKVVSAVAQGSLTDDQRAVLNAVTGTAQLNASVALTTNSQTGGILGMTESAYKNISTYYFVDMVSLLSGISGILLTTYLLLNNQASDQNLTAVLANAAINSANIALTYARNSNLRSNVLQGAPKFATGGVFTNSVVSRPTEFNMAQMGEAGPEAIMPLQNIGGSLGVRAIMPKQTNTDNEELVQELRALRAEVQMLRAEARATAVNTNKTAKLLDRSKDEQDSLKVTIVQDLTV